MWILLLLISKILVFDEKQSHSVLARLILFQFRYTLFAACSDIVQFKIHLCPRNSYYWTSSHILTSISASLRASRTGFLAQPEAFQVFSTIMDCSENIPVAMRVLMVSQKRQNWLKFVSVEIHYWGYMFCKPRSVKFHTSYKQSIHQAHDFSRVLYQL